jgi:hypothetical protein
MKADWRVGRHTWVATEQEAVWVEMACMDSGLERGHNYTDAI